MQSSNKICVDCKIVRGTLHTQHNIILCMDCIDLNKYKIISKTNAKRAYKLKDVDLETLTKTNGSKANTYYYLTDVLKLYIILTNLSNITTIDNLIVQLIDDYDNRQLELQLKRSEKTDNFIAKLLEKQRIRELEEEAMRIYEQPRKKALDNALQLSKIIILRKCGSKYNLNLIHLCTQYISGVINNIDDVVTRMCQIKYLYEYCKLDQCETYIQSRKSTLSILTGLEPNYIEQQVAIDIAAEDMALNNYSNKCYPVIWPWLINVKDLDLHYIDCSYINTFSKHKKRKLRALRALRKNAELQYLAKLQIKEQNTSIKI